MLVMRTIALFMLICLSFATAEVKNTFKRHETVDSVTDADLSDNLFALIKCENPTKESKSTKCQVSQEPLDGKYTAVTCEVVLDNHVDDDDVLLRNLGKDKVVISWWSEIENVDSHQFIRHSIVDLPECKVVEANINQKARDYSGESWNDLKGAFLNRGNGTFDVFYYTKQSKDISRVTFNTHGKIVAGPVDLFDINENFRHMLVHPTSKKDLHMAFLAYSDDTYEFSLYSDDGSWEFVKSFGDRYKIATFSGDHDTIRVCTLKQNSSNIICKVYNSKEKSISIIKIDAVDFDDFDIQNLANNEFLLLTSDKKAIHITKYGADGKKHGKIEVPTPQCEKYSEHALNGNEECIARLCGDAKEYDVVNYCFNNEDFK